MATRKGIMLAYQYDPKRLMRWRKPFIMQPKLEGDRCRASWDPEIGWVLYSSSGAIRTSVPHINVEMNKRLNGCKDMEFDGELFVQHWPHERIRSIVSRTVTLHPEYERIQYHIFDYIHPSMDQNSRLAVVESEIPRDMKSVKRVPYFYGSQENHVEGYLQAFIFQGYEGIILREPEALYVRRRATTLMKLKPRMTGYYLAVEMLEESTIHGMMKGMLGSLVLRDIDGRQFKVGTGFTEQQRLFFWESPESIIGKIVKIQYQSLTESGIPKMSSFKEVMEEGEIFDNKPHH